MEKRKKPLASRKMPVARMARRPKCRRPAGLRPLVIWVPDTSGPAFAAEARRQSLRVSRSPDEEEALRFIEAAGDFSPEDE